MSIRTEYFTRKEIENLYSLLDRYPDEKNFKVTMESNGIADLVQVWIKISDREQKFIDISDYENW